MVKTFLSLLFFLCSLSIPAWALPPSGSPGISSAAQDAAGSVWATPPISWAGQINRRQAGAWVQQTVPGTNGFRLWTLARGDDGTVYAFWQQQSQTPQCLVTMHRGDSTRILARFSGLIARDWGYYCQPTLYAGAAGDVWIAGCQPLLWHIAPDGSVQTFPLTPEEFFGGKLPDTTVPSMASLVDGDGRRWFWQDPQNQVVPSILRGFLIWDGKTLAYHATLPGLPDCSYSAAAPQDAAHFWLVQSVVGYSGRPDASGGLYRVDTHALSAALEMPPQRGAFQRTTEVFQVNGDTYVKALNPFTADTLFWRKRSGQWQLCFQSKNGNNWAALDPWLSEPSGIWFGADGGAWWLPYDGRPAVWVDWRRGLAVQNVTGLFALTDGCILAFGSQGTAELPPVPQPVRPLPPDMADGGMGAPERMGPVIADSRHHLWGLREHTRTLPLALAEWDGEHWRLHMLPASTPSVRGLYAADALGRLWLSTYEWHPPAQPQPIDGYTVYDPIHDTWTNFATVRDGLQAAAALPGMAFLPDHTSYQPPPVFSGDGRVTYSDHSAGNPRGTKITLYDGKAWRSWQTSDILTGDAYATYGEDPYFSRDGSLEIVLNNQVWAWTGGSRWQKREDPEPAKPPEIVPPGGPPGLSSGSSVVDSLGAKWFTWQNAVYTASDGLWVKQSELSSLGTPFQQGVRMTNVLQDPAGRLFFETLLGNDSDLFVWSPPPVPKPGLSLVPISDDSVAVHLKENLTGPHWCLWRLNGGAWNVPTTERMLSLTTLPRGDYRVEVRALDRHLLPSQSAVAVFSIRVTPSVQIARWVRALLSGTDNAREVAVAGLAKQPGAALPALRAARPGASDDGRWWIDAALQQLGGGN